MWGIMIHQLFHIWDTSEIVLDVQTTHISFYKESKAMILLHVLKTPTVPGAMHDVSPDFPMMGIIIS